MRPFSDSELKALAIIKASIKEAYDDSEKGATLFASGLIEKFRENNITITWE